MKLRFATLALLGAMTGLAACDGGNGGTGIAGVVNQFGARFAAAFFADPNADILVDPRADDLTVDPTADPIDV
ncbi:hypothetical protein [Oceaniglobus trochenteri]|uniref:hypothetical protein n=1 Tax=Oceaniglobus trochenteri TaxID=2763260 RepID=UPI001D000052|nr:hypothetical protein [Oceaniglobus trochenteri]